MSRHRCRGRARLRWRIRHPWRDSVLRSLASCVVFRGIMVSVDRTISEGGRIDIVGKLNVEILEPYVWRRGSSRWPAP